ncbi:MAG: hypothetical protein E7012_07195 [Alphaproteobacteria bacterium]|nr:hypothetical protein [Alphaproteobacteria bacterium]
MSSHKIINILLLVIFLSSCSQFRPFVDRRREAGVKNISQLYKGASTPKEPAICYNSLYTPYADVKKLADNVCITEETGTHAVPVKQTYFTCRLLVPNHFYFKCKK